MKKVDRELIRWALELQARALTQPDRLDFVYEAGAALQQIADYPEVREPVCVIQETDEIAATVVCDDGSTWYLEDGWKEWIPIPGSKRALELEAQE